MGTDERNFRSIYYEKVGFKSVEEKKSLEMLLKEKNLDRSKLKQFSLRFAVPHTYRSLLWELLLGVLPMQTECHKFVMSQRIQEYNDLLRTLQVTGITNEKTPKSHVFLAMWLIQTNNLTLDTNLGQDTNAETQSFVAIAKILMTFFDDDVDIFWIARRFYDGVLKMSVDVPKLVESTYVLFEKEEPDLYRILMANSIIEHLPLARWFHCCFAGIFNDNCIIKIWDKVCGGSYKILSFLVVTIFITMKHRIGKLTDVESVSLCIKNMPEETAEVIVNKTIDMWQHHGSPLTVHDKPKTLTSSSF